MALRLPSMPRKRKIFEESHTDCILLAVASNAFNSLNRKVALHNIRRLCPSLAATIVNTYRCPARLLVDGDSVYSREGTTQGDPLAMPMYALDMMLLLQAAAEAGAKQAWYADDSSGAGTVSSVREWWDTLESRGPVYGYYTNSAKSILLVKSDKLQEAQEKFEGAGVEICFTGVRYLGAATGSPSFKHEYITENVQTWVAEIKSLPAIAKTQPQAAYAVIVHAMKRKWTFLARTMQEVSGLFTELEQAIDDFLIPAVTDRPPVSKEERQILSLPCRNGGLGLINPTQLHHHHQDSAYLTGPLANYIVAQVDSLGAATAMLAVRKREAQLAARAREKAAVIEIRESAG